MSGTLCPVCRKKVFENYEEHVEKCAASVTHDCPACGQMITRVHKAEDRITTAECNNGDCDFSLTMYPGGKLARLL